MKALNLWCANQYEVDNMIIAFDGVDKNGKYRFATITYELFLEIEVE